jgi:5-methylcytosine-specific restriction endonuclease McrA
MEQTLLLNATYEPITVVPWQRAMTLWAQGKAEIVDTHDREVKAVSFSFKLPSIIRLLRFVRLRTKHESVPFTRANIYARDNHSCAYCGAYDVELTLDHVVPESRGGKKSWDNIVAACRECNKTKGARTPEEAGMMLLHKPVVPNAAVRVVAGKRRTPSAWQRFLYWAG